MKNSHVRSVCEGKLDTRRSLEQPLRKTDHLARCQNPCQIEMAASRSMTSASQSQWLSEIDPIHLATGFLLDTHIAVYLFRPKAQTQDER